MAESKHTPGPWRALPKLTIMQIVGPDYPEQGIVGTVNLCRTDGAKRSDGEANARLIVASPVMREALEAFVSWASDENPDERKFDKAMNLAKEALTQVKGGAR